MKFEIDDPTGGELVQFWTGNPSNDLLMGHVLID